METNVSPHVETKFTLLQVAKKCLLTKKEMAFLHVQQYNTFMTLLNLLALAHVSLSY